MSTMRQLRPEDLEELRASEEWAALTEEERSAFVERIEYDFDFYARPKQQTPPGEWLIWFLMGGRGSGKTRTGAEQAKKWALNQTADSPVDGKVQVALVATTFRAGHQVMVEGESGLLNVLPPSAFIRGSADASWNKTTHRLTLANGSWFQVYTSERPDQLRGPQHHFCWGDEPAEWMDAGLGITKATTFTNLQMGLRLGQAPQMVLTGTPKRTRLIRELLYVDGDKSRGRRGDVVLTQMTTYENLNNLAPTFREAVISQYEGTSLGAQELEGELLDDVEGALWTYDLIDKWRVAPDAFEELQNSQHNERPLQMVKAVVAIDPAVTANPRSDETGIVVGAKGSDGHVYILADLSDKYAPDEWAAKALGAFDRFRSDAIVCEVNNGGDLVINNIKRFDKSVPVRQVRASRGKIVRAEPVKTEYELGHVHHVGRFPLLEEQMTSWDGSPTAESPDRMDALVWLVVDLLNIGMKERGRAKFTDTSSPSATLPRPGADVVAAANTPAQAPSRRTKKGRLRWRSMV